MGTWQSGLAWEERARWPKTNSRGAGHEGTHAWICFLRRKSSRQSNRRATVDYSVRRLQSGNNHNSMTFRALTRRYGPICASLSSICTESLSKDHTCHLQNIHRWEYRYYTHTHVGTSQTTTRLHTRSGNRILPHVTVSFAVYDTISALCVRRLSQSVTKL